MAGVKPLPYAPDFSTPSSVLRMMGLNEVVVIGSMGKRYKVNLSDIRIDNVEIRVMDMEGGKEWGEIRGDLTALLLRKGQTAYDGTQPPQKREEPAKVPKGCIAVNIILGLGAVACILALLGWIGVYILTALAVVVFVGTALSRSRSEIIQMILPFSSFLLLVGVLIVCFVYLPRGEFERFKQTGINEELVFEWTPRLMVIENDTMLGHDLRWENYTKKYYGRFMVSQEHYKRARMQRELMDKSIYRGDPTDVYGFVVWYNRKFLAPVFEMFDEIRMDKGLNQREFAEAIVTSIQSIPYTLIMPVPCYNDILRTQNDGFDYDEECVGNVRFGFFSPAEFIAHLKGDCDTRTLLAYSILQHFGFDVVILNSNYYKHSMLGINLPDPGEYKMFRGRKYIVWETTSRGMPMGHISYQWDNLSLWRVVLSKELNYKI